jgi:NAD+ synthase (glutamine-hydrolysing)
VDQARPFASLYSHGFVRVAACTPRLRVADPAYNAAETLELARRAAADHAALALFPELGLAAYTSDDLFFQDALLDGVEAGLRRLIEASRELAPVIIVGAPLRGPAQLFNCAVAIHRGRVLGVVPKSYLPNYREFYEKRWFASGAGSAEREIRVAGGVAPFGTDLLFAAEDVPDLVLHAEICEDLWAPIPPSSYGALAGATVLANLSASNVTVGKAEYRRLLCAGQSGRSIAGYLYVGAGPGESTTDLAWDGHALIAENATLLAESRPFPSESGFIAADLDLDRLRQERARTTSFADCVALHRPRLEGWRRIGFRLEPPTAVVPLRRAVGRFPYVPPDRGERRQRCEEVHAIQVQGLATRMQASGIGKLVIGVSGGLDSTNALLVAVKACERLGLPRSNVLAFTMPGFATGKRTYDNAWALMRALGVSAEEIDIRPSATQMLRDIGHAHARGEALYDVTFENVQAGERTSHLFRLANDRGGLVVGTSDLSELALGFTTYGVGDHMAHYGVNASVPKTLIRHLIRWAADSGEFDAAAAAVLRDILATEISPELVPATAEGEVQRSEDTVGPYPLQDFNLYYISRFGFRPSKVAFLAHHAWGELASGEWPDTVPEADRRAYDLPTIVHWLEVFIRRFFQQSQFKRSALPNAPKVGSGGSLSPRGDWRAPSDSRADAWLEELRGVPVDAATPGEGR